MPQPITLDLQPWFVTLDDLLAEFPHGVDWAAYFGNANPVEIDVGCGRGKSVLDAALANPDVNFVGIEIDFREGRHGAKRLWKRELPNARIWGGDVARAFDKLVATDSVRAVHVYFPDPWWKKKHRRRRVFTDAFVDRAVRVLEPGGLMQSWTDVEEYFGVISALLDNDARFERLPALEEKPAEHDLDYRTNFERKKRQAGETIHRGRWRLVLPAHFSSSNRPIVMR
jgi:tRNA (guanine-N7-)-methyltransferase